MVYLPTLTLKIKHSWIGKYTNPMDPSWEPLSEKGHMNSLTIPKRQNFHPGMNDVGPPRWHLFWET